MGTRDWLVSKGKRSSRLGFVGGHLKKRSRGSEHDDGRGHKEHRAEVEEHKVHREAELHSRVHQVMLLSFVFLLALADAEHPFNSASLLPGTLPTNSTGSFRPGRRVGMRPKPLLPFWVAVGQHFFGVVHCRNKEWSHQGMGGG